MKSTVQYVPKVKFMRLIGTCNKQTKKIPAPPGR